VLGLDGELVGAGVALRARGHYELGLDVDPRHRLPAVLTELALAI
jgi:hypothetical protein